MPPNEPIEPIEPKRWVERTCDLILLTTSYPASRFTPAAS